MTTNYTLKPSIFLIICSLKMFYFLTKKKEANAPSFLVLDLKISSDKQGMPLAQILDT